MALFKSYVWLALAALLAICVAAPPPKRDPLEPQEDLKTDATLGFGYALPYYSAGYYPYSLGYSSLGYGYGYGYPSYYYGYGGYPYYYY